MRISDCSSAVCSSDLDDTSVLGLAADARPGNALIGVLLGDLGVELALDPGNVGDPVVALLAHLADRLHPAHELREGLELGPLVVGRAHRHVDVDGLIDLAHRSPSVGGATRRSEERSVGKEGVSTGGSGWWRCN